ncbi:hypothetical protein [Enterovibrio nigricans]|uniref:Uncharacterized protein n=1 Tax=Enterovibrio nigricans DSM 22720 TaxID=1121868 RepID=A0A1T4V4A8_9GAMM|nr:hypothetical protein [Enterovibrio nigricans]PKF48854.1 hypothetical protein AT251_23115 [Enterovibrio nigricans]SKA59704.1 hypothetical protein SAMN02745132_03174 [Enterovibrio nigricans DSM 22720]
MATGYVLDTGFFYELALEPPLPQPYPVHFTSYVSASCSKPNVQTGWPQSPAASRGFPIANFYHRDFKNSLFLTPKKLDLGFITGESSHSVELWSSYEQPLTLVELEKIRDTGISLIGNDQNGTLPAYGGHWSYALNVSRNVEFDVSAQFRWLFGIASAQLAVTGSKIVLWHHRPIFPLKQTWSWSNAVIEPIPVNSEFRMLSCQYNDSA